MSTRAQAAYLRENADKITGPAIAIGARHYDYDAVSLADLVKELGVKELTITDIEPGLGVDRLLDITVEDDFIAYHEEKFSTVFCLEVLTNLNDPFAAARNATKLLRPGGTIFLAECIVRKLSRMPADKWRFTYDGLKTLFPGIEFDDSAARLSITRDKGGRLLPYPDQLPGVREERSQDESALGYLVRRVHRKYLAGGLFRISTLLPEMTVHAVGRKQP